jgi:hypothetical protein
MVRRRRLIVQLALGGLLALLAFPGASSALAPTYLVSLTASGPSPAVLTTPASFGTIRFHNIDSVSHTIAFANGACTADIAPDDTFDCGKPLYVGHYPYTVDGASQANIVIKPAGRSVTLHTKRHSIRPRSAVTLHGSLAEDSLGGPPTAGSPQRIIVAARPYRGHPFHRAGVVEATVHPPTKHAPYGKLVWHLRIHPRSRMTYVAIASYQPKGGQVWERAVSKPFRINVRHRP